MQDLTPQQERAVTEINGWYVNLAASWIEIAKAVAIAMDREKIPATTLAAKLGKSRQRVYQLRNIGRDYLDT